jgi:hypothetical protein
VRRLPPLLFFPLPLLPLPLLLLLLFLLLVRGITKRNEKDGFDAVMVLIHHTCITSLLLCIRHYPIYMTPLSQAHSTEQDVSPSTHSPLTTPPPVLLIHHSIHHIHADTLRDHTHPSRRRGTDCLLSVEQSPPPSPPASQLWKASKALVIELAAAASRSLSIREDFISNVWHGRETETETETDTQRDSQEDGLVN